MAPIASLELPEDQLHQLLATEEVWTRLKDLPGTSSIVINLRNKNGPKIDSAPREVSEASIKKHRTYPDGVQAETSRVLEVQDKDLEAALEGLKLDEAEEKNGKEAKKVEGGSTHEQGTQYYTGPQCKRAVLEGIEEASESIHVMMYQFTDRDIARALIAKAKEDIEILVIMSDENFNLERGVRGTESRKAPVRLNDCGDRLQVRL